MNMQALSLRAALSTVETGEGHGPRPVVRLTVTTTTPRHVRESPTGPVTRTEWVSEDRVYELPAAALDSALEQLQALKAQLYAPTANGRS